MEVYDRPEMRVEAKADESPVTEADLAADAIISNGLRAAFPRVTLVTEEQAASHDQKADTFLIVAVVILGTPITRSDSGIDPFVDDFSGQTRRLN